MTPPIYNNLFHTIAYKYVNSDIKEFFDPFENSIFSTVKNFKIHINTKPDIIKHYVQVKKYYNSLSRFAYLFKIKKSIKYNCNTDLYGNEITSFKDNQLINIYQNNTLYKFRLTDIINIFTESLLNQEGLFPVPKMPKNPYTNLLFKKHHLYNIYTKLVDSNFPIPIIIKLFYKCKLSIRNLLFYNYPYLKEKIIENYPENTQNILGDVIEMIEELKYKTGFIFINSILTKKEIDTFVKDFSKPLVKWFKSKYSPNPNIKDHSKKTVVLDLKKIYGNNSYKCLKDRVTSINIRDTSNNIILRRRPITIPPPPPPVMNTNPTWSQIVSRAPIDIETPIVNNFRPTISLPPLLRPLISGTDQNILIDLLNSNDNPENIFGTSDRIPRSPVNIDLNSILHLPTNRQVERRQQQRRQSQSSQQEQKQQPPQRQPPQRQPPQRQPPQRQPPQVPQIQSTTLPSTQNTSSLFPQINRNNNTNTSQLFFRSRRF